MYMSYGQHLVPGEGTSLSRVGPYRFCSDGNPMTLSIQLWSYLVLSDTHIKICISIYVIHIMYAYTYSILFYIQSNAYDIQFSSFVSRIPNNRGFPRLLSKSQKYTESVRVYDSQKGSNLLKTAVQIA